VTWGTRNQTLSLLGSTDGTTFTTVTAVGDVHIRPEAPPTTVTITFTSANYRYWRG